MIQRGEQFGFALKAEEPFRVTRESVRKYFDRNVAFQSRVARAIHLAHTTGTDQCSDLVWADVGTGRERHRYFNGTRAFSSSVQFNTTFNRPDAESSLTITKRWLSGLTS